MNRPSMPLGALLGALLGFLGCSSEPDAQPFSESCFDRTARNGGCCPLESFTRCGGVASSAYYCRTEQASREQAAKQAGCSVGLDVTIVCCQ